MGQHSKPPSRVPQQAAAVAAAMAVGSFAVSDSGAFTAVSPADTTVTSPVGIPVVGPTTAPVPSAQPSPVQEPPVRVQEPVHEQPVPVQEPVVPSTDLAAPPPPTAPSSPPTEPSPPSEVTARPGDTLSTLASAHGQSWQDLWRRNLATVSDPNKLRDGQVLSLAAPLAPPPASQPAPPAPANTAAPERESASEVEEPEPASGLSSIVGIAQTFYGTPYRWGGKSTSAVDCSGLVFLVLKKAGLTDTYRTSSALRDWAIPIKKSEARPGDLVFGPGHVGIYAGGGMMIDAPKPGKTVGLHKVYRHMTSYGRIPT